MKKRMFRMLCVVLALALLAPNVFAATPPPEVPLADEATVTRVKNEIAAGEITDLEDVFLVAYQHLGADLEEEGMTAYINEDGTLGFTQIISSSRAEDGRLTRDEYAITTILLVDNDGNQVTDYSILLNKAATRASGGLDSVMVYASHTAYYLERWVRRENGNLDCQARLSHMTTTLSYGSNAFSASRLVQSFNAKQNHFEGWDEGSQTTENPVAGTTYYYYPSGTLWYWSAVPDSSGYGGGINTYATVYITNSNLSFTLETHEDFYYDPTIPRG